MGGYPSTVFSNRLTAQTIFVKNPDFLRTLEKNSSQNSKSSHSLFSLTQSR